jgi:hypothetical protein
MADKDSSSTDTPSFFKRFPVSTMAAARQSFARLVSAYARGKVPDAYFRSLVYGLSALVKAHETGDLAVRLEKVEAALREAGGGKLL